MNTKEKKYYNCEHCLYAIKHYISIGNKMFFNNVSACSRLEKPPDGTAFKIKEKCLYFRQDSIPSSEDDIGQHLLRIHRQLDEITDILCDIIDIIDPDDNETNT